MMQVQRLDYSLLEPRKLLAVSFSGTSGDDVISIWFESETIAWVDPNRSDAYTQRLDITDGLILDLSYGRNDVVLFENQVIGDNPAPVSIINAEIIQTVDGENTWQIRDNAFLDEFGWSGTLNDHISFADVDKLFGGRSTDQFFVRTSNGSGELHGRTGDDLFVFGRRFGGGDAFVFGDIGDDSLVVRGDRFGTHRPQEIHFDGGQGHDRLVLNDRQATNSRPYDNPFRDYEVIDNSIRWRLFQRGGNLSGSTNDLNYSDTVERVRINGANEMETRFMVAPNQTATKFFIDAGRLYRDTNLLSVKNNSIDSELESTYGGVGYWLFEDGNRIRFNDVRDTFDFESFVGLTDDEARELANDLRVSYRYGSVDGVPYVLTLDYVPKRITVSIVDNIVTKARQDDGLML